jgi:hypothetical protein
MVRIVKPPRGTIGDMIANSQAQMRAGQVGVAPQRNLRVEMGAPAVTRTTTDFRPTPVRAPRGRMR